MPNNNILEYAAPKVRGIPDNDPAGIIPPDLLRKGIEAIVPIWPLQSPSGNKDELTVWLKRNGVVEFESITDYLTPITLPEIIIPIGPEYLVKNGVVELSYETKNYLGNPHPSLSRILTIDHKPPPADLPRPWFPKATFWGYLNCFTIPPIWHGIEINIPTLSTFCEPDDLVIIEWFGYLSQNVSGPVIPETYKEIKRVLSREDILSGFSETVEPYVPHIEPMKINASAKAVYTIYRGTEVIGSSKIGWVKIDRVIPDSKFLLCGP